MPGEGVACNATSTSSRGTRSCAATAASGGPPRTRSPRPGQQVVVVDIDEDRLERCPYPHVLGDASADEVLRAGRHPHRVDPRRLARRRLGQRLRACCSARSLNPDLFVIARVAHRRRRAQVRPRRGRPRREPAAHRRQPDRRVRGVARRRRLPRRRHARGQPRVPAGRHRGARGLVAGRARRSSRHPRAGGRRRRCCSRCAPAGTFVTNPTAGTSFGVDDVLIVVGTDDAGRRPAPPGAPRDPPPRGAAAREVGVPARSARPRPSARPAGRGRRPGGRALDPRARRAAGPRRRVDGAARPGHLDAGRRAARLHRCGRVRRGLARAAHRSTRASTTPRRARCSRWCASCPTAVGTAILVGHNPGCELLVDLLAGERRRGGRAAPSP